MVTKVGRAEAGGKGEDAVSAKGVLDQAELDVKLSVFLGAVAKLSAVIGLFALDAAWPWKALAFAVVLQHMSDKACDSAKFAAGVVQSERQSS